MHPIDHHPAAATAQQFEHPPIRDPPTHLGEQSVWSISPKKLTDIELGTTVTLDEPWRSAPWPCVADRSAGTHTSTAQSRLENRFQHELGRLSELPGPHVGMPNGRLPPCWFRRSPPARRRRTIRPVRRSWRKLTQHRPRRTSSTASRVIRSTPAAPLFLHTRNHASHRTSPLQIRSNRAWKRRPSDCLAAAHSACCSSRTFTADGHNGSSSATASVACRGNWTGTTRSCPHAYPLHPRDQSGGPSLPARYAARRSAVLRPIGLPLRSERLHHRLIRLVSRPTQAAQTGLSSSEPDCVHVPSSPTPERLDELTPEQGPSDMAFTVT